MTNPNTLALSGRGVGGVLKKQKIKQNAKGDQNEEKPQQWII